MYIHTTHALSPKLAGPSQIFLRNAHVLPKLPMRNSTDVTGGKPIAVWSQSISGVRAINPLVAFYDIHGRKREVLLFVLSRTPHEINISAIEIWRPIWRSGRNTRLLRKRSRVRFPHSANICVHEHVCLYWVWVFLCIICMYLQEKMYISMCLSVI
jgi:hypothetical protein